MLKECINIDLQNYLNKGKISRASIYAYVCKDKYQNLHVNYIIDN